MASASDEDHRSLPEQFQAIFDLHQELEKTEESMSCDRIQGKLREGMKTTESAIQKVNQLELFSRNEEIDEVSTNEIKYMLLSAYLGHFTGLNTHLPRLEAVTKSKMCYEDFLRLCNSYGVTNVNLPEENEEEGSDKQVAKAKPVIARSQAESVQAMAGQRASKIQRFQEKKQLDSRIAELQTLVERDHVDDEVKREFYLSQVKRWSHTAQEETDSCAMELQMLAHRQSLQSHGKGKDSNSNSSKPKPAKPFRPFILTKSQLQKRVFGAGYPSIPSMTVDEFYEQKLKEGTLSESVHKGNDGHSMQNWAQNPDDDREAQEEEAAEKERLQEVEDQESLQRARAFDDWKDDHRRGDGNRHNKG